MAQHIGILLVFFFINILLVAYVWVDSKKKNMDSGFWVVVIFLLGLIGFGIYAIKRPAGEPSPSSESEPDDSIDLVKLSNLTRFDSIGRHNAETLYNQGYETIEDIKSSTESEIVRETSLDPNDVNKIKKQISISELREIPGVGDTKAGTLYAGGFESMEDIRKATVEELAQVDVIGPNLANRIKQEVRVKD